MFCWAEARSPEQVFGIREKPFRYGNRSVYTEVLTDVEIHGLSMIIDHFRLVCHQNESILHMLLVGSAALGGEHGDFDLLVCTDPATKRIEVANSAIQAINADERFYSNPEIAQGSAVRLNGGYLYSQKIYAMEKGTGYLFDISFVAIWGGKWEEIIDFHERLHLAHAIVID